MCLRRHSARPDRNAVETIGGDKVDENDGEQVQDPEYKAMTDEELMTAYYQCDDGAFTIIVEKYGDVFGCIAARRRGDSAGVLTSYDIREKRRLECAAVESIVQELCAGVRIFGALKHFHLDVHRHAGQRLEVRVQFDVTAFNHPPGQFRQRRQFRPIHRR